MKIDKKLIKELVDNLKEFELSELEYHDTLTQIAQTLLDYLQVLLLIFYLFSFSKIFFIAFKDII